MKVRLRSICPVEGLDVDFSIPAAKLAGEATQLAQIERFSESAQCQGHLEHRGTDVFFKATGETGVESICDRCGETYRQAIKVDVFLTCSPRMGLVGGRKKPKKTSDLHEDSDEGLVYFEKSELDLAEIMREQILLALPVHYLCKTDCKGLCNQCGINLNFGEHQCKRAHQISEAR